MLALVFAAEFVLYLGFFYLLGLILQMGVPFDALRASFHRLWLGAAATMVCMVAYMLMHLWGAGPDTYRPVGAFLIWASRVGIWIWVATSVYRVTRWRKGKLAISVLAGLALSFGIDVALEKLQETTPVLPALGDWILRLC